MIVAGFGFRRDATVNSLRQALAATAQTGITALAAPADKAATQGFKTFANTLNLPVILVEPDAIRAAKTSTKSAHSLRNRGTGSVAEACALAAAGPQAKLTTERHISPDKMATCAIAKGPRT